MKKYFKILLILLMFSFTTVYAETINDGLFRADDTLVVNENLAGTSFLAGNSVTVNNNVDGILFAAGNILNVNNTSDYAFVAGSSLNLTGASFKDGFIAGSIINIKGSNIERDLYVAGGQINLESNVGRNAYIAGSEVVIDSTINGDLEVDGSNITINSNARIIGTLKYNEDANITISKDASIANTETYVNKSIDIDTPKVSFGTMIISKITSGLFSLFNLLVVGLLLVLLFPRVFKKIKEIENAKILSSLAWGLLVVIVVPIVSLLVMITVVGLSTGIITLILYGVLMYLSTIFASYKLTAALLGNKIKNDYLLLLIGLAAVFIIKLIPFLGGLCSFMLVCLGIGLVLSIYKRK